MKLTRILISAFAIMFLALFVSGIGRAEVTCVEDDDESQPLCELLILLGITEEPDPVFWESYDTNYENDLNPGGAARGDGPPGIAVDPRTGLPVVTWSYNLGTSFEVVVSGWTPEEGWQPIQFVTTNAFDDLDPRAAVDDEGVVQLTWWSSVEGVDTVWKSHRNSAVEGWSTPLEIAAGARPSILRDDQRILIAFERPGPGGGKQVVLHTRGKGIQPTTVVLAETERTGRLDVELHSVDDRMWIDWKHSDSHFAYLEYIDGTWGTEIELIPWLDMTWIGVEVVRREIRSGIVDPQDVP